MNEKERKGTKMGRKVSRMSQQEAEKVERKNKLARPNTIGDGTRVNPESTGDKLRQIYGEKLLV